MKKQFFGTDGIRGRTNQGNMTAEVALRAGMAAGSEFKNGGHRHKVVIGKDTRLSGYMLEPALTSGFVAVGMDVILVGPMPTPAISMLTRSFRADLGVMISASHNAYHDNGIKFFDRTGVKLSDEQEQSIEARIRGDLDMALAPPDKLGRAKRLNDAQGRYIEFVKYSFPKRQNLSGLKIVLDCANGAAYHIGPPVLWELEAEVIPLGVTPDGFNINKDCGSTAPEQLCAKVLAEKADIGIALDGDADRLIVCDEKGQIIDGDQIMASIAAYWKRGGLLKGGKVVATHMSNMGLEEYLAQHGIALHRTQIGDRYVAEGMRDLECNLGGEQSGHIILRDYASTGDGLIAALQLLAVLVEEQKPASHCLRAFTPYPQVLENVHIGSEDPLENEQVQQSIKEQEKKLGENGRVLIRKSGTEPLLRIMVEGKNEQEIKAVAEVIKHAVQQVGAGS